MTCEPIDDFLQYMAVIRSRSPRTVTQYEWDLTLFFRYLLCKRAGNPDPGDEELQKAPLQTVDYTLIDSVKRTEIMEFFVFAIKDRENNARTRARKLSALRSFYKYHSVVARHIENNPAAEIDAPKTPKTLPRFLTLEESLRLLETIRSDVSSGTRERDYAIVTLFLNCGMRLSELTGISLSDVDSELRSLRVTGKGAKDRIVYLNEACQSALSSYLKVRDPEKKVHPEHKNALFLSSQHRRISKQMVQTMVYKYLDLAGLGNKKCSVHKLRHTAATLMYQTGNVDLRVLKDILGHEQLSTTQIYTHVSDQHMEEAMRANPLSGIKAPEASGKKDEDEV